MGVLCVPTLAMLIVSPIESEPRPMVMVVLVIEAALESLKHSVAHKLAVLKIKEPPV